MFSHKNHRLKILWNRDIIAYKFSTAYTILKDWMHPFKWSYNIIMSYHQFSIQKEWKFSGSPNWQTFFYNDILYLFWVYDLFTFYKYIKTMPISDVSLQKHCINNVIFRIQRFYKGVLSNRNNERSHSEQFLDRNIKETGLKWPYNVLKMAYNAIFIRLSFGV